MFKAAGAQSPTDGQFFKSSMFKGVGAESSVENDLLRSLSAEERARLGPSMQRVTLTLGQVVYEAGGRLDYAYFPTTALVSWVYTMQDGSTAQTALVGNDGVAGIALFLGRDTTSHRAVVQIGGDAFKVPSRVLQMEFARGGMLQRAVLRYTQALLTQISQTAVCNRLHSIEQRLCRWLLVCDDRMNRAEILMTQENIANMLGGRREGVTVAAGRLQDAGLIQYSRGHIKILDRKGLEAIVCECYQTLEDELERLSDTRETRELSR
jgi:CRP-like cAMP-binding protein